MFCRGMAGIYWYCIHFSYLFLGGVIIKTRDVNTLLAVISSLWY